MPPLPVKSHSVLIRFELLGGFRLVHFRPWTQSVAGMGKPPPNGPRGRWAYNSASTRDWRVAGLCGRPKLRLAAALGARPPKRSLP